ncbi:uncharacterized protein PgNI_02180 [Pyricularia grisea]|uniref:Uncharacterized protein n=1 Tax=Pyricularia grisea TaxID=148305 RepID=A0A6P8BFP2_PYRGI|nr:uncharacterized protein PgNI_02180 [Pyricularia grisea]TLD15613.1 hypothetical protein PgNI_02180 [Pyricularia grisea]
MEQGRIGEEHLAVAGDELESDVAARGVIFDVFVGHFEDLNVLFLMNKSFDSRPTSTSTGVVASLMTGTETQVADYPVLTAISWGALHLEVCPSLGASKGQRILRVGAEPHPAAVEGRLADAALNCPVGMTLRTYEPQESSLPVVSALFMLSPCGIYTIPEKLYVFAVGSNRRLLHGVCTAKTWVTYGGAGGDHLEDSGGFRHLDPRRRSPKRRPSPRVCQERRQVAAVEEGGWDKSDWTQLDLDIELLGPQEAIWRTEDRINVLWWGRANDSPLHRSPIAASV